MAKAVPYRRAILGMGPAGVERQLLRKAADFARMLELQLLGIFVEDQAVLGLADLPFARELRLPGHDWQALEPGRMLDELRAAAEQARQLFDQEVVSQGLACHFEVRRGDPATLASGLAEPTDIVIVAEPAHPADRLAWGFIAARRAALASRAAVLLLPPSAPARAGPVAVVAAGDSDPAVPLASRIAVAAGAERVVVRPGDDASAESLAVALRRALGRRHERLLILTRAASGVSEETALRLATERRVPVLLVEPATTKAKSR